MTVEYDFKTCPVCGIHYALDHVVSQYKLHLPSSAKDRNWYCPNGHSLVYTDSEADKWRREAERAKQENARLMDELAQAARREKAMKKRASAGTCPCCNRTFSRMAEHMKRKHPEFVAEQGAKVVPIKIKCP